MKRNPMVDLSPQGWEEAGWKVIFWRPRDIRPTTLPLPINQMFSDSIERQVGHIMREVFQEVSQ